MGFGDLKKQSSLGSLTQVGKEVEKQNGGGGQRSEMTALGSYNGQNCNG